MFKNVKLTMKELTTYNIVLGIARRSTSDGIGRTRLLRQDSSRVHDGTNDADYSTDASGLPSRLCQN